MPIPNNNGYIQTVYFNIIKNILDSRLKNHVCLNQQDHDCVNQPKHYIVSINIIQKQTNYLLERWKVSYEQQQIPTSDYLTLVKNSSQFISELPSPKGEVYFVASIEQDTCYSYMSNETTTIDFRPNSHLKASHFQLSGITIELIYDDPIQFMPWSNIQEQKSMAEESMHPLTFHKQRHEPLQSPTHPTPFIAVRRLSRLSLSAMNQNDMDVSVTENDDREDDSTFLLSNSQSIPIPSSRMQYTHYNTNKRSTLAFSPSNTRFLSPSSFQHDFFTEKRSSFTQDLHHYGSFVGSFEESLMSGRMSSMPSKPILFHSQIGVLGYGDCKPALKCPAHWSILFPASYYKLPQQDQDDTPVTPYVGTVDITDHITHELKKSTDQCPGYRLPPKGQLQVMVKNPNKIAVKLFLIPFDFTEMPKNTKTFLRQTSYTQGQKKLLRYAIHIQVCRTEKKRIYLYKSMKIVFANQKIDAREKFDIVCEGPKEPVYIPL